MERTICDLIRSRSGIEMQTFQDALLSIIHIFRAIRTSSFMYAAM